MAGETESKQSTAKAARFLRVGCISLLALVLLISLCSVLFNGNGDERDVDTPARNLSEKDIWDSQQTLFRKCRDAFPEHTSLIDLAMAQRDMNHIIRVETLLLCIEGLESLGEPPDFPVESRV